MESPETRIEAVVDALVAAAVDGDPAAREQARNVADWASRICRAVPGAPTPAFVRRCALLAGLSPDVIACVPEVAECSAVVRDFQRLAMTHPSHRSPTSTASLILVVAEELDALVFRSDRSLRMSPRAALAFMKQHADQRLRPLVDAACTSLSG
ncbi:MAG TPA: hypothetical protein VMF61_11615 [Candidatus Acidoferrales bacterium]|nr:hypothetical protein [Candidatus Acidoferrales bacterium]